MKNIVILPLASFNDDKKKLCTICIKRLEKCVEIFNKFKGDNVKICLSGGFGKHFNPTNETHSILQENYLIEKLNFCKKNIDKGKTGSFEEITNTVQEAISLYNEMTCENSIFSMADLIIIVTSPFHFERSVYLMQKSHSKVKDSNKPAQLLMIKSNSIPIKSNFNDGGIDFLNPLIPKKDQKDLWFYYQDKLSNRQEEALIKYEAHGLNILKNEPFGMWKDFLDKN